MDLSGLVSEITPGTEGLEDKLRAFDIVNDSLPNLEGQSPMDESQLRGLHRIVSKELAIVQGPPGTGKTFTSVEAIKVMVRNRRRRRNPPIIVAAQTNHALDQLLVHCLHADIKILRLGGRTKSEEVKPHTIYEQRQNSGTLPSDSKMRPVRIQMKEIVAKVVELRDSVFGDSLLNPDLLLEHGIITGAQHQSLIDDSMESAQEIEELGPFALWLGNSRIPATLRVDRHATQPERSEAEARRNLPEFEWDDDEAIEDMDVEDEKELLRATHIEFKHTWTGKDPAGYTSWDRIVQRALRNDDLFRIPENLRGAVYQYFQSKMLEVVRPRFIELLTKYVKLCKERQAHRFHANVELVKLQCYDIIGCTTTGLSKYRGCLAAMQPVSLLIEEAAETREANIVSALYPTLQQLILVGDHKQLAPKCDIIHLGDPPYNLNISLFERMVNLGNQYVMLNKQRRMKPELREIVMPFYEGLEDHPSVTDPENRPDVPGMGGRNCWLFHHTWPEDMNSEFSKFNEMEAEMIANFFAYLMANGTEAQRITVLTFYKGQRKVLLNKLNRHPSIPGLQFNVCTVDSFQGEENDVILLSMVRSPQLDRPFAVGFLEDSRRATVAISRARRGFYVFGNVENVLSAHEASKELWRKICEGFANQGMFDSIAGMPIVCQNHGKETWIREIGDWDGNAGGCDQPCGRWRHCGHPCQINCHP
jgi:helicase required for RNAi-mediated heterochromatin assembly 1